MHALCHVPPPRNRTGPGADVYARIRPRAHVYAHARALARRALCAALSRQRDKFDKRCRTNPHHAPAGFASS